MRLLLEFKADLQSYLHDLRGRSLWRIYLSFLKTVGPPYWLCWIAYSFIRGELALSSFDGWFEAFGRTPVVAVEVFFIALYFWLDDTVGRALRK